MGYFYHDGKYIERNMKKAIYFYKEASSFNNHFAKNNLGIIYKNGICEIQKNIGYAIIYFDESIRLFKDKISMYNLAHIYIYEEEMKENIDESINLLIQSINLQFIPSIFLLIIALIKKHGFNLTEIKEDLITSQSSDFSNRICQVIKHYNIDDESIFHKIYDLIKNVDYMYDFIKQSVISKKINEHVLNQQEYKKKRNISKEFYEGFGEDII